MHTVPHICKNVAILTWMVKIAAYDIPAQQLYHPSTVTHVYPKIIDLCQIKVQLVHYVYRSGQPYQSDYHPGVMPRYSKHQHLKQH